MTEPRAERPVGSRRRRLLVTAPWLCVLVAVGAVQVVREQWVDAAMFLLVAAALFVDAGGWVGGRRVRGGRGDRRTVAGLPRAIVWPVAAVAAVVLTLAPRHGVVGGVAALALGAAAVAIAWLPVPVQTPDPARRRARIRSGVLWAVVAIATCVWELVVFTIGRVAPEARPAFPSISEIVDPWLDGAVGRGVFVVGWIGFGLFLLTRARPERLRAGIGEPEASARPTTGEGR